jgi:hypothetical protein
MSTDELNVLRRANDLSHQILCLTEELHDLLVGGDDESVIGEVVIGEVKVTQQAAESMDDTLGFWLSQLTPYEDEEDDDDEDEDESASASAPASP